MKVYSVVYLINGLSNLLQIWSVGKRVPPQQIWYQLDKRSQSYECLKIATLLFLLIYLCSLRAPSFGPHDTLPCILIIHMHNLYKWIFLQFNNDSKFHKFIFSWIRQFLWNLWNKVLQIKLHVKPICIKLPSLILQNHIFNTQSFIIDSLVLALVHY